MEANTLAGAGPNQAIHSGGVSASIGGTAAAESQTARPRLPFAYRQPAPVLEAVKAGLAGKLDWSSVRELATPWVAGVRERPAPFWAVESLLQEFPLGSSEGRALMRLAEALLRIPDMETAAALAADQLAHVGQTPHADSAHPLVSGLATQIFDLSKRLLPAADHAPGGWLQRLGTQAVVAATVRAVQLLGRQFVLGRNIDEALGHARTHHESAQGGALRYSFDMLGEGARSEADAQRYLASYANAIDRLAATQDPGVHPSRADGISIKLSALYARYEEAHRAAVMQDLLPRVWQLAERAARAGINLTVDAEESDRLELSLDVFDALAQRTAREHRHWAGLGLAVQAYQTRSREVVDEVLRIAYAQGLRVMVRLVKGAYWDAEIKRAQELGLPDYPVYTHKPDTDLAYLGCAQTLLAHPTTVFAQFATHNAATVAAVAQMAAAAGLTAERQAFEWQRLHGMGEAIYREIQSDLRDTAAARLARHSGVRIYAPVGEHRDLLAYLVRRLLENGANASFVHQLSDERVSVDTLLASPLLPAAAQMVLSPHALPLPADLYGSARHNAYGVDLSQRPERAALLHAVERHLPAAVKQAEPAHVDAAMRSLHRAATDWQAAPLAQRCAVLRRAADALEEQMPSFIARLVQEGRKTLSDALGEVRETIDACRYYAQQAETTLAPHTLPGPTGESNELRLRGRGVFVCIAPWNFPLAIFGAQVAAALVAGNSVAAKPAEQTPAVAQAFVTLLIEAGVPRDALALFHGPGETVGAALAAHPLCAGVAFTGSTAVAKAIQRQLAHGNGPIVPLIAETGGLNAMIVDSTALLEQAVDAVIISAFGSAGQRCSALRLLCVQTEIADALLAMLAGAMTLRVVGPPHDYATDVGPVIDSEAHAKLHQHIGHLERHAKLVARTPLPQGLSGDYVAPCAYEIQQAAELREEVFGPVLHVLRWGKGTSAPTLDALIDQINALGYGLTLGVQTRIDSRAQYIAQRARVGNVYINRGMTGAVMGVQPFGGEALSGTGPKAGGPHYLLRFCVEQTVTVNTAAAGGNADLLA